MDGKLILIRNNIARVRLERWSESDFKVSYLLLSDKGLAKNVHNSYRLKRPYLAR